jgi:hypothetical protein
MKTLNEPRYVLADGSRMSTLSDRVPAGRGS